jgi:hypothetical protein
MDTDRGPRLFHVSRGLHARGLGVRFGAAVVIIGNLLIERVELTDAGRDCVHNARCPGCL